MSRSLTQCIVLLRQIWNHSRVWCVPSCPRVSILPASLDLTRRSEVISIVAALDIVVDVDNNTNEASGRARCRPPRATTADNLPRRRRLISPITMPLCPWAMSRGRDEAARGVKLLLARWPTPLDGLMASVSTGRTGIEASSVVVASGALLTRWRSILGQFSRLLGAGRQTNRAVDIRRLRTYLRAYVFVLGAIADTNVCGPTHSVCAPPPRPSVRPSRCMRTIDVHPTRA